MKPLVEATKAGIRHLEQIRAACEAAIAAENELLRVQRTDAQESAEDQRPQNEPKKRRRKGK